MENVTKVPSVTLSEIEKLLKRVREVSEDREVEISFEFIIGSLFPTSWNNIQEALSQQYIEGYRAGYRDGEEGVRREKVLHSLEKYDCYCE